MKEIVKEAVVIGAGWCGIYALKHLAEEGIDCLGLDKREEVGGLWAHTDDQSVTSVPDCTYTSSPKLFTEAVDFPWPEEIGIYPRYDDVHKWLKSYVQHFQLTDRIMLHSEVTSVQKVDGLWEVSVTRRDPAKKRAEKLLVRSKFLVVSTGVNMALNDMREDSRLQGFTGEVIHSNQVRRIAEYQEQLRDKRVVSIGGGENASDLTYFGSRASKSFTLCIPNGQWMQIRNYLTRTVPIHKVAPVTREKLGHVLPWEYQKCVFRCWVRPMWGSNGWDRQAVCSVNGEYGHGQEAWKPVGPCYGNFGNKADLMHHALSDGSVVAKRDIQRCEGRTVFFDDGSSQEDVDTLVLCTGYRLGFPFLPEALRPRKIRALYKNIFHPDDPSLAFVGFSRPTQGSIPQLAEMASLFVSRVFAGRIALPPLDTMRQVAAQDCQDWDLFFRYSSGRVTGLVDQILYSRELADAMGGSFAPLEMLWTYGPRDWLYYLCAPATLHSYLGKIPGKRDIFLKFIRENNLIKLYHRLAIVGVLYGIYDILFYQLGRLENLYNEVFDPRTRQTVGPERVWKESRLEKWWLSYAWDAFMVFVVALLFMGKWTSALLIAVAFVALLIVVHFVTIKILYYSAQRNRNFILGRISKFKWA